MGWLILLVLLAVLLGGAGFALHVLWWVAIIAVALLALWPFGANVAQAHAFLDHAEPRVGSTVQNAPRELSLSFTQELEPAFSTVEVLDANGKRVDQGKARISGSAVRVGDFAKLP